MGHTTMGETAESLKTVSFLFSRLASLLHFSANALWPVWQVPILFYSMIQL